jgi:3-hydroxyisobutyrate dehydrogenase-like beta-hydroxyacid dehydrogenase
MKIGFIGMGIMGSLMAANLMKKGHELVVFNRTKDKTGPLVAKGAVRADSAGDLAQSVPLVFTMLSTPDAVYEMALGEKGFLEHLQKNSLWVDCSTVNPSFSRQMAEEAAKRRIRFLDAPVAGSKIPAEQGQLVFFVGGKREDMEFCRPLFDAMGKAVVHVGGHGTGTSMKMVNNLLLAGAMLAFSESMVLGETLGISRDALFQALLGSPVTAPFLSLKKPLIEEGSFKAQFPMKWMHKDLHLAAQTAYESGVSLPAAAATKETYSLAIRKGFGEKDFSSIYQFLKSTDK